ncbi:SGNH/GDSL hydrolase family protein [Rhodococcoides fascians]|uniref:SGNH/GDSL hydrolase family protein n=1 Tax=Rhodococcoides fascians TaxID=1828 RepID=UPI0018AFA6B7|nr:SGNH/GDSL hydrolase family protein [Rhodococcus fascians]
MVERRRGATFLLALASAVALAGCGTTGDVISTSESSSTAERPSLSSRTQITVPADPYLLIMGDSNTQGYAADDPIVNGYAYLVKTALGWNGAVDGVPGTGWTWGGGVDGADANKFSDRITRLLASGYRPNVIIFEGGENDYRLSAEQTSQAVIDTIEQARQAWPGAQVVVMGPVAPQPLGARLAGANDAIVRGALQAQAAVMNPLRQSWFTDENSLGFSYGDGSHLNTAGHRYLADRILADLPGIGIRTDGD